MKTHIRRSLHECGEIRPSAPFTGEQGPHLPDKDMHPKILEKLSQVCTHHVALELVHHLTRPDIGHRRKLVSGQKDPEDCCYPEFVPEVDIVPHLFEYARQVQAGHVGNFERHWSIYYVLAGVTWVLSSEVGLKSLIGFGRVHGVGEYLGALRAHRFHYPRV